MVSAKVTIGGYAKPTQATLAQSEPESSILWTKVNISYDVCCNEEGCSLKPLVAEIIKIQKTLDENIQNASCLCGLDEPVKDPYYKLYGYHGFDCSACEKSFSKPGSIEHKCVMCDYGVCTDCKTQGVAAKKIWEENLKAAEDALVEKIKSNDGQASLSCTCCSNTGWIPGDETDTVPFNRTKVRCGVRLGCTCLRNTQKC